MNHFVCMRERGAELWAKWQGLVSEQIDSGQSVAAFCRDRGLTSSQLFAWKKRLRKRTADPQRLGAEIGLLSILHTWSSNLLPHYHVHCVVPGGGLSADHSRWIHTSRPMFLLPIPVLRTVFRNKFLDGLRQLYGKQRLDCRGPAADFSDPAWFQELTVKLSNKKWFVYAKPPFGGPAHVLRYLGRYTHRMAISNHRLTGFDGEHVSFRWRDYAHGSKQRVMTLDAVEFLRRFFLHVLPLIPAL